MYVCICNAFTDSEVRQAIRQSPPRCVADVYRSLGCEPVCGKCKPLLQELVMDECADTAATAA
jgi:bacterioferritin-associated ferredoxin